MPGEIRTYLVGRRNRTVPCDIAVPEHEKSVSRKHLELTLTPDGQCYLVHVHSKNTTKVQGRDGSWVAISQDYVDLDAPLMLGTYRTTARQLLAMVSAAPLPPEPYPAPPAPQPPGSHVEWDPERGSFLRR